MKTYIQVMGLLWLMVALSACADDGDGALDEGGGDLVEASTGEGARGEGLDPAEVEDEQGVSDSEPAQDAMGGDEVPDDEAADDPARDGEASVDERPGDELPGGDGSPSDETPIDDPPGDENPEEDVPGEDSSSDDDTPTDDLPDDDTPTDDLPADDSPTDETPDDAVALPELSMGPVDDTASSACDFMDGDMIEVTAVSDIAEAGQVLLLPTATDAYLVTLPESGEGFLTLQVPEWAITLAAFLDYGTTLEVLDPNWATELILDRSWNGACPDTGLTDQRLKYHTWGSFTVRLIGEPNAAVPLSVIKVQ